MNRVHILYVILFLAFGCNNSNNKDTIIPTSFSKSDTIKRAIPEWYRNDSLLSSQFKKVQRELGLNTIEDGYDSLQIRIWIECASDTQHTIVITNDKSKWSAYLYNYQFILNEVGEINSIMKDIAQISPYSGWSRFSKELLATGIKDLLDFYEYLPDYSYPTDANTVSVEIATSSTYRLYQYPALASNVKINEGPAKLEEALLVIEKEFNYKRACD